MYGKAPCKDCPIHSIECHSHCIAFIAFQEELKEIKAARKRLDASYACRQQCYKTVDGHWRRK